MDNFDRASFVITNFRIDRGLTNYSKPIPSRGLEPDLHKLVLLKIVLKKIVQLKTVLLKMVMPMIAVKKIVQLKIVLSKLVLYYCQRWSCGR